ncbi:hypothetical protein [Legionella tunisiensis]|uniref:hypothetical protein n=1 Tax=Legionella tunisiensis TaxID=1034944 RepID=UPI001E475795|nr:hypothetical protein [Legionella tunisiensis]
MLDKIDSGKDYKTSPIHLLRFIYELRQAVDDSTTVCCDIGTVYMWMARYFFLSARINYYLVTASKP